MAPDDPGRNPANDPRETRRIPEPGPSDAAEHATRRIDPAEAAGRTQRIDPDDVGTYEYSTGYADYEEGGSRPALEGEAEPVATGARNDDFYAAAPAKPPSKRGKGAMLFLGGLVFGIVVAFVVIALGSSESAGGVDDSDQIAELETELEDRDAQITDLQAQLDAADVAAGEDEAALQEQRDALDDRATGLDQRASQLDDREAALDEREQDVQERESAPEPDPEPEPEPQAEQDASEGQVEGNGGFEAPDLPSAEELEQQAETIVDQVLEGIRNLFGSD